MKILLALLLTFASVFSQNAQDAAEPKKRLLEVCFAADDRFGQSFHTEVTLWLSEKESGTHQHIHDWSRRGSSSAIKNPEKKAKKCRGLFKTLAGVKEAPPFPTRVATVKCLIDGKMIEKAFSIDRVPAEVRTILIEIGFHEEEFTRLTFLESGE